MCVKTMTFRIVENEDSIYDDEGGDNGLVQSVDWAHITYGDNKTLYIANGGAQLIGGVVLKVLRIYVHHESDSIWLYCRDIDGNQVWNILFNDLIRYKSGLGMPPLV